MTTKFKAWVMRGDIKTPTMEIEDITIEDLPPQGEVLVKVLYTTINYKDGLVLSRQQLGRLVKNLPHVPGIDYVGEVVESEDDRYTPGDKVILTGWKVGEWYWGGYSEYARVNADFLVKLPGELSPEKAMAVGTAGITAMFCVEALEAQGLSPHHGPVLVTGAAGGVGTVAILILSALGYEVVASSGRESLHETLKDLGASRVLHRSEFSDGMVRPLDHQHWAACVDSVGGATLSKIMTQIMPEGSVAACGLAGGFDVSTSIMPFILRGVNLLGINSVERSYANRVSSWDRITSLIANTEKFDEITSYCKFEEIEEYGAKILKGDVFGRLVVEVSS